MKKLTWGGLALIALIWSSVAWGEETIRLTNGEWEPWLSEKLKHYGLASRIVAEAFASEGVTVKYEFFPWKRAYVLPEQGKYDGSVIWSRTPEREKDFYYSDKVLDGTVVFFHLKSYKFDWKTIDDLKGIPIGATLEYTYGEAFDQAVKSGKLQVEYVPTDEQNFKKLLKDRIKIFAVERDVGYDMIQSNLTPEEAAQLTHHPNVLRAVPFHLILTKKIERNAKMLERVNKGLKKLYDSGKVDQYIAESNRGEYKVKK